MKLSINNRDWGTIPSHSVAAIQFYCAENNHQFHLDEEAQRVEVRSSLHGKKVWLSVNTKNATINNEITEKVIGLLTAYGIVVSSKRDTGTIREGDLLVELVSSHSQGEGKSVSVGYNERLNSINVKKNLSLYKNELPFKGYYLIPEHHSIPHLRCSIKGKDEKFLLKESPVLLTQCVLKTLLGNQKPSLLDLNVLHLFQMGSNQTGETRSHTDQKNPSKDIQMDDKTYEEIKMRKANRKVQKAQEKKPYAEIYFDYNVIPNRKSERYTIKADFFIKNTGNVDLMNPKICFRMDPPDKIEIGGQILPPEMSEIFSLQGQNGAQGWKYMGKDWLEKAYSTGEYWIESIQESFIPQVKR
ncbi:hypothetical protein FHE72_10315 [Rossellomorea vietnamensis]|uniref:Uncharacterized protein n=1 Tax=Rossellomorea vietnamensis TaxID=218284 RepID=A0A6I6URE2_9BACI|nr:hypothetical protein [Rossellomorea vietnamensis]QHE61382.1 hypothetical protein FHE72_10315 [Rossellomorea vietnamensis]